jgi:hypothetical protein
MSAGNLLIPFDFNPVESKVITTNYTIPAGRYARVLASGYAGVGVSGATFTSNNGASTSTSNTKFFSIDFWCSQGDVISFSTASSVASLAPNTNEKISAIRSATVNLLLNSSIFYTHLVQYWLQVSGPSSGTSSATFSAVTDCKFLVTEYNVIQ